MPAGCSWARPGANPYRGDPVRALADFAIPEPTRRTLRSVMADEGGAAPAGIFRGGGFPGGGLPGGGFPGGGAPCCDDGPFPPGNPGQAGVPPATSVPEAPTSWLLLAGLASLAALRVRRS